MKRILFFLLIIPCVTHASNFTGFYAGGAAGISLTRGEQSFSGTANMSVISDPSLITTAPLSFSTDMFRKSFMGLVNLGYGNLWNNFYLGGEIFVSAANHSMDNTIDNDLDHDFTPYFHIVSDTDVDTQAKINSAQFGLLIRPGYLINANTMMYAKLGAVFAKIKVKETVNSINHATSIIDAMPWDFSANQTIANERNKMGVQIGAGVESFWNQQWSIRLDYTYSFYGSVSANGSRQVTFDLLTTDGPVPATFNLTSNNRVRIEDHAVLLGLNYYFC